MMNKVIKTEEDYNKNLSRISALMDAQPGTPEFDELELLSTLVEVYENQQYTIPVPDPLSAIKFRMEQLGLTQRDLTVYFGSRSKVSEVMNGKRKLSLSMIRALHRGLGIPSEILINEPKDDFSEEYGYLDFDKFPIKEMAKKGWIPNTPDIIYHSEDIIKDMIDKAGGQKIAQCCLFRRSKSPRDNVKNDPHALMAWCLKTLEIAQDTPEMTPYKENSIDDEFLTSVAKLSYFTNGPLLVKEYLEKNGIHFVTLPHLRKTYLDGSVISPSGMNPVIALTLRYDRIDNFWFCILHELAHLRLHNDRFDEFIVDDLDLRQSDEENEDEIERQADLLAQEALIPDDDWQYVTHASSQPPDQTQIFEIADKLKIHPAIIAGRIRYETKNYRKYSNLLGHGTVRKLFFTN